MAVKFRPSSQQWVMAVLPIAFALIIVLGIALSCFFLFTTKGSSFILRSVLSRYVKTNNISVKKIGGNLAQVLSLEDIEMGDLKEFLQGGVIKIQRLDVNFSSLNIGGLNLNIHNGRLNLPNADPIFFYGAYKNTSLDLHVYSKRVGVRETLDLFSDIKSLKNIAGAIADLDISIKGSFAKPGLTGEFRIENLSRNGFSLVDCPGIFTINLSGPKNNFKVCGEIVLKSGKVLMSRTTVQFQQSKILFSGDPKAPSFDFKGTSVVEGTKIEIALKGTKEEPELKLTSEPPMAEERIMLMLATGKSWQGAEGSLGQGKITPELARDFVDYFVFSGSGSKIAERFGINVVSLKYDSQKKGIGVKKEVSKKAAVSYGIEQSQTKEEKPATTHTVGGEYKITESISVEAEKGIKEKGKEKQADEKSQTNDRVLLKIKTKF